jgi:tetraacyldisaccharide-1-P 4'-kinase
VFRQADSEDAEAIVITEKDAVKFPLEVLKGNTEIPVYVISVEVTFKEGAEEFRNMLSKRIEETIGKGEN